VTKIELRVTITLNHAPGQEDFVSEQQGLVYWIQDNLSFDSGAWDQAYDHYSLEVMDVDVEPVEVK
jgi:hypothetical protein